MAGNHYIFKKDKQSDYVFIGERNDKLNLNQYIPVMEGPLTCKDLP